MPIAVVLGRHGCDQGELGRAGGGDDRIKRYRSSRRRRGSVVGVGDIERDVSALASGTDQVVPGAELGRGSATEDALGADEEDLHGLSPVGARRGAIGDRP